MNTDRIDAGSIPTQRVGLTTYATVCCAVLAVVLLSNWPAYQFAVRGGMIPLYYYLLPAAFVVPLLFAEPASALRVTRAPLFWWFTAFVLTGLLWLLIAQDILEEATRQWRLRALSMIIFVSVLALAFHAQRRAVGWVIVACVVIACAFNWFDALRPFRFVPQGIEGASEGRGAGLFINPNAAGSFIVLGTIAALPMIPVRLRGFLLVTAVFGVAATFSRGAFVMVAATLLSAVWLKLVKRGHGIVLIVGLPLLLSGITLSYDYLMDASDSRNIRSVVQRLNWFSAQVAEDEADDQAVAGRLHGARTAWLIFLDHPATGKGPGATSLTIQQDGPHNMYLLLMAEQGILGLALYIALFATLIARGRRIMRSARAPEHRDVGSTLILTGVYLAAHGFFSHNVLEEPHTMFLLAFVAAAALGASGAGAPRRVGVPAAPALARRRMRSSA